MNCEVCTVWLTCLRLPSKQRYFTFKVRGGMSSGLLKLTDEKVVFAHAKNGKKDTVRAEEIELVNWQRLAGGWGIRIFTKDGNLHRFAGFKEAERERVANHFSSNYNLDMLDRSIIAI